MGGHTSPRSDPQKWGRGRSHKDSSPSRLPGVLAGDAERQANKMLDTRRCALIHENRNIRNGIDHRVDWIHSLGRDGRQNRWRGRIDHQRVASDLIQGHSQVCQWIDRYRQVRGSVRRVVNRERNIRGAFGPASERPSRGRAAWIRQNRLLWPWSFRATPCVERLPAKRRDGERVG